VADDAAAGVAEYPAPVISATDGNELVAINGEFAEFTVTEVVVECEHANAPFFYDDEHEIVAAQGTASGETAKGKIFFKCADCGEIIEEEVSYYHSYTTGTQNAQLESEIRFEFKAQPKHLNAQGTFEDAYFVIDMAKDGGDVRQVTNYVDVAYEDGDKPYYVASMGVAAKEMTALMTSTVYVKYDGKWWSGLQWNMKLVDYLVQKFASFDDAGKTLLVDMMNFGAVAQNHFGFNTADLASDYIGDYASYATKEAPTIEDKSENLFLTNQDLLGYNAYGLDLGSIIAISLTFRADTYVGDEDVTDLTAVCTYTNNAGEAVTKSYTSAEYTPVSGKNMRYTFNYNEIAAKDMRKIVTCTLENENGQIGYELKTSIESVAAAMKAANPTKTTLCDTIDAMMVYGDSANAFFNR
ncbi:MAG: hypothetical protein IJD90_03345, partial [Clostridia bacterium]|nr:hypothetical protein [Clostridia bacterium]